MASHQLLAIVLGGLHDGASLPSPTVDWPGDKDDAARLNDPPRWGTSLTNVGELLFGCLDAVQARSILEIGAYEGDLTVEVLGWAKERGAEVASVDPDPPAKLRRAQSRAPRARASQEDEPRGARRAGRAAGRRRDRR